MKQRYEELEMQIVVFDTDDVIEISRLADPDEGPEQSDF